MIAKVLVANRGEIAVRIMRTLKKCGIVGVAVYSADESYAMHVRIADEAYLLPGERLDETYLNAKKLIDVALVCNADAIHPGYGFLSENAEFALMCEEAGITFLGPDADSIAIMGDKQAAKRFARDAEVPTLPVYSEENVPTEAYPLLVKAVGGGGGKGMVQVHNQQELDGALESAAAQAQRLFGDNRVYLEPYLEQPRHIEVQVAGDGKGQAIHLFERECSIQRNFQKIVEEAPSPSITPEQRAHLLTDALSIARKANYRGLGTIEFLVDKNGQHYFLEMNTRIQVEHPVTERITGKDLVALQLAIANGSELPKQETIQCHGHAIEVRVYAEDPAAGFIPQQGRVHYLNLPETIARHDMALQKGDQVQSNYDALLLKQVVYATDRKQAINKAQRAIGGLKLEGVITNTSLLSYILSHKEFETNQVHVKWLDEQLNDFTENEKQFRENTQELIALAGIGWWYLAETSASSSPWTNEGAWRLLPAKELVVDGKSYPVTWHFQDEGFVLSIGDEAYHVSQIRKDQPLIGMSVNGMLHHFVFEEKPYGFSVIFQNTRFDLQKKGLAVLEIKKKKDQVNGIGNGEVIAHQFGKVVKLHLQEGEPLKIGTPMMVVEAMKMENTLLAPADGMVEKIHVQPGQQIADGDLLITYNQEENLNKNTIKE